ncbi:MAG TPA: hypothetical protein VGD81_19175 [Opitutaceae bacterium]
MSRTPAPARLRAAFALASLLAWLAGCTHAHFWGAKAGGQPAVLGGDVTIPLGKK